MANNSELDSTAYDLADRYRDGRYPELKGREWKAVWTFLLGELRKRCPGFSEADYTGALEKGFADSR